jgi:hypothetical protein
MAFSFEMEVEGQHHYCQHQRSRMGRHDDRQPCPSSIDSQPIVDLPFGSSCTDGSNLKEGWEAMFLTSIPNLLRQDLSAPCIPKSMEYLKCCSRLARR